MIMLLPSSGSKYSLAFQYSYVHVNVWLVAFT